MNFNFETIGNKNSSALELLSTKYATFYTIHDQKWSQIFEPIKTVEVFQFFRNLNSLIYSEVIAFFSILQEVGRRKIAFSEHIESSFTMLELSLLLWF